MNFFQVNNYHKVNPESVSFILKYENVWLFSSSMQTLTYNLKAHPNLLCHNQEQVTLNFAGTSCSVHHIQLHKFPLIYTTEDTWKQIEKCCNGELPSFLDTKELFVNINSSSSSTAKD